MIFAPSSEAYWMALAISDSHPPSLPDPLASRTFKAISLTLQQTPATPLALFPTAPIVPAQCVPCPASSSGILSAFTKSQPLVSSMYPLPSSSTPGAPLTSAVFFQRLGDKSGWARLIPVSSTATTTLVLPVVKSHAPVALILTMPHSSLQRVSFGTAAICER